MHLFVGFMRVPDLHSKALAKSSLFESGPKTRYNMHISSIQTPSFHIYVHNLLDYVDPSLLEVSYIPSLIASIICAIFINQFYSYLSLFSAPNLRISDEEQLLSVQAERVFNVVVFIFDNFVRSFQILPSLKRLFQPTLRLVSVSNVAAERIQI